MGSASRGVMGSCVTVITWSPLPQAGVGFGCPQRAAELAETELLLCKWGLHEQGPCHGSVPAAGDVGQRGQGKSLIKAK